MIKKCSRTYIPSTNESETLNYVIIYSVRVNGTFNQQYRKQIYICIMYILVSRQVVFRNSKTLELTERFRQGVIKTGVGTKKVFKRLCYSVYKAALLIPVYDYTTLGQYNIIIIIIQPRTRRVHGPILYNMM